MNDPLMGVISSPVAPQTPQNNGVAGGASTITLPDGSQGINPASNPSPLPRVTPTPTATPPVGTPAQPAVTGNSAVDYVSGATFTPPPTQEQTYQDLVNQSKDLIDSVTQSYKTQIEKTAGGENEALAAAGLGGATGAPGAVESAISPIIEQRNTALAGIYDSIAKNAISLNQQEIATAQTSAENAVAYQKQAKADALATAQNNITALAKNGFDYNSASKPDSPNYQTYQNLLTQVGGDPNVLNAMFALAQPAENVIGSYFTSDGSGGTTVNQVVQDPVTGKISHLNYSIPGYTVPPNWQAQKIGNNSLLLTSPNFATDPSNPANLTFMSVDPTNRGALTVVSANGTTVNGVPVSNSSPSAQDAETQANSAYASKVINDTATFSGVQDITQPMSEIIANTNIGVDGVVNGIKRQEGGSPSGVVNNPGNIKVATAKSLGLTNFSDSGVKGTDGGTYANFDTFQDGNNAVATLVRNAANKGKTFEQFITAYKGLKPEATSSSNYDINSGIAPTDSQSSQIYVTPNGVNTGFTNQAIYDAGVNYATTGKSPSLGLGSSADTKAVRAAIQNSASAYAKSLGTTYPKLQEEFAFAKAIPTQTLVANSNTVINSINDPQNGLLTLSDNVNRGNITLTNSGLLAVKEGTSDPATVDFVNKVNSTADELGKIFGSGAGSDFTTQLAQSLINPNLSKNAFKSSMQTIMGSVQNKVNAFIEQAGGTIGGSTNTGTSTDINITIDGKNYKQGDTVEVQGAPAGLTFTAQADGSLLGSDGNTYQP